MCKRSTPFLCICLACLSQSLFSLKLTALQHNGASTFFTDLPATLAAAMSGDTNYYLPGGISPWKEGSVPFNPHINLKTIAPTTNSSGNLPVQIRVAAQDH